MFKTSFSKYLTAFVVIIFVSFVILSSIITSIIRDRVYEDNENTLALTCSVIAGHLTDKEVEQLETYVGSGLMSMVIDPVVNLDVNYNIIITDANGRVLLTTVHEAATDNDGKKKPITYENDDYELGFIDISILDKKTDEAGSEHYTHKGRLGDYFTKDTLVYAKKIVTVGEVRGYVLSVSYIDYENQLVAVTRRAVINSSIWVMFAAVIAAYFITDRIIHPLKSMKNAVKKFAKGDFSERVTVYGNDEVAELAKAFNNMAESLDSLEKMRNSFLANISHDLRTPMTTISGFIDGINSGAIPPEKHSYYLGVISAEVHRLSRLVSQILDVSRLESGERKFNFQDFDVAEVSRLILISFEQKIDSKKLDVSFDSEYDEMIVNADMDAIYQVMYNLCHNAIKFAKDEGKFVITIKKAVNKKIEISVFDEGQTISEEDTKLVFERFYKTDKSRGLDKNGVGLGLYISKTIIDAHGENITVESGENGGCKFTFTLKEGTQPTKRKSNLYE